MKKILVFLILAFHFSPLYSAYQYRSDWTSEENSMAKILYDVLVHKAHEVQNSPEYEFFDVHADVITLQVPGFSIAVYWGRNPRTGALMYQLLLNSDTLSTSSSVSTLLYSGLASFYEIYKTLPYPKKILDKRGQGIRLKDGTVSFLLKPDSHEMILLVARGVPELNEDLFKARVSLAESLDRRNMNEDRLIERWMTEIDSIETAHERYGDLMGRLLEDEGIQEVRIDRESLAYKNLIRRLKTSDHFSLTDHLPRLFRRVVRDGIKCSK